MLWSMTWFCWCICTGIDFMFEVLFLFCYRVSTIILALFCYSPMINILVPQVPGNHNFKHIMVESREVKVHVYTCIRVWKETNIQHNLAKMKLDYFDETEYNPARTWCWNNIFLLVFIYVMRLMTKIQLWNNGEMTTLNYG